MQAFLAGDFSDRAAWSQITVEHAEVSFFFDRLIPWSDDVLLVWICAVGFHVFQRFRDGLARDREAVAVEQAAVEQQLHHRPDSTDADEVGHAVFAEWLQVSEQRHAFTD